MTAAAGSGVSQLAVQIESSQFERAGRYFFSLDLVDSAPPQEQRTDVAKESSTAPEIENRRLVFELPAGTDAQGVKLKLSATELLFSRGSKVVGTALVSPTSPLVPGQPAEYTVELTADEETTAGTERVASVKLSLELEEGPVQPAVSAPTAALPPIAARPEAPVDPPAADPNAAAAAATAAAAEIAAAAERAAAADREAAAAAAAQRAASARAAALADAERAVSSGGGGGRARVA